jgi:hypothetical protein
LPDLAHTTPEEKKEYIAYEDFTADLYGDSSSAFLIILVILLSVAFYYLMKVTG